MMTLMPKGRVLRVLCFVAFIQALSAGEKAGKTLPPGPVLTQLSAPVLDVADPAVATCYRRALATVQMNIVKGRRGVLAQPEFILNAGQNYNSPWTRDATYNTQFACRFIAPKVARNTLISVLTRDKDYGVRIGGQYWDCICWVTGAWSLYCATGDGDFLKQAFEAGRNSIRYFEDREFDAGTGLFDGPGWSDGVAGYPMPYADAGGSTFILDTKAKQNGRVIMKALSTNCLYANAYHVLSQMAIALGSDPAPFRKKSEAVKAAINRRLWMEDRGHYAYFLDMNGKQDPSMEGLGHAFALLFDIAPPGRRARVLAAQHIMPRGIPCTWPLYPRFGKEFGRHDGTIWPQIQGFWAWACADARAMKKFYVEFDSLTSMVTGSGGNFREIYHPVTGKPYGGLQCGKMTRATDHQSWAATAYLSMIFHGIFGLALSSESVSFQPMLKPGMKAAALKGFALRRMTLDIHLSGAGKRIIQCTVDGKEKPPVLPLGLAGNHVIRIALGN